MPHNNLVTNYRAKFLELAADNIAAASLYLVPEEGGARLETGQYKARQSHLSLLGKMWFMSDKVKEFQVGMRESLNGQKAWLPAFKTARSERGWCP